MHKFTRFFAIIVSCLVIVGCQQTGIIGTDQTDQPNDKQEKAKKQKEQKIQKKEKISYIGEEIEQVPAGEFFAHYIGDKEFTSNSEYAKTEEKAIIAYINEIQKENTQNWSAEDWAQSLIINFRTNHQQTLQPIRDFNVQFDKITMPDGRLLQDVSEEDVDKIPTKVNVALLLDASGSMKSNLPDGNKLELAKASLKSFSESLPTKTQLSLYVFGHRGTSSDEDKALSCGNIETVYPLQKYTQNEFNHALNQFNASGWTPLAAAIEKAQTDLLNSSDVHTKNFIYVVSDGVETCDGNPIQAAKDAKAADKNLEIHIIGFDVDDEADRQLKEVAKAGGGQYTSVNNQQQLHDEVTDAWKKQIGNTTWIFWQVGQYNNLNFDALAMSNQLNSLFDKHLTSRNREFDRMNHALNKLVEDKMIDYDLINKIYTIIYERHTNLKEHADEIKSEKHNEIYDTLKRLTEMVDSISKKLNA